jgi:hypothetical protein
LIDACEKGSDQIRLTGIGVLGAEDHRQSNR